MPEHLVFRRLLVRLALLCSFVNEYCCTENCHSHSDYPDQVADQVADNHFLHYFAPSSSCWIRVYNMLMMLLCFSTMVVKVLMVSKIPLSNSRCLVSRWIIPASDMISPLWLWLCFYNKKGINPSFTSGLEALVPRYQLCFGGANR